MYKYITLSIVSILLILSCSSTQHIVNGDKSFEGEFYREAISHYETAITENEKSEDELTKFNYDISARTYSRLAESYFLVFNYKKAVKYYNLFELKNTSGEKKHLKNYSQSLRAIGEIEKSKVLLTEFNTLIKDTTALTDLDNLYNWVEQSDETGPYKLKRTNIMSGRKFSGMHFRNNNLYYSTPRRLDLKELTSMYKIVKAESKKNSNRMFFEIKDVKNISNYNFNNGSVSFNQDKSKMYYYTDAKNQKDYIKNNKVGHLYFGNKKQVIKSAQLNIDSTYSNSKNINFCFNRSNSYTHPFVTKDGQTMYFVSDMPGGEGGFDIYKSEKDGDYWNTPVNLGPTVNTDQNELFPFFNNNELYFASYGHVGFGGSDIFVAKKDGDAFLMAENVGKPINSERNDLGLIFIDDENIKGYFATNRHGTKGNDQVFYIKRRNKDSIKIVSDSLEYTTTQTAVINLYKKYGNEYKFIEKKITDGKGVDFRIDKGITYRIISKNIMDSSNVIMNINPENRRKKYTLYTDLFFPTPHKNKADSTNYYLAQYNVDKTNKDVFKKYADSIHYPTEGTYAVNGAFEKFDNLIKQLNETKKRYTDSYVTFKYIKSSNLYYNLIYIGDKKKETISNFKALKKRDFFNESWMTYISKTMQIDSMNIPNVNKNTNAFLKEEVKTNKPSNKEG
ncbi:MAG: PD40 domain-containing protein [Ichthyobacteriaceae bacterium]|nr:PD40 domain-containing protein [Ichthyobacteriaceae bacterium]